MNRLNHPTTWARTDRRETRYFNHRPNRLSWSVETPGEAPQQAKPVNQQPTPIERPAPSPTQPQQPGELTFDFQPRWWPSTQGGAGSATQTAFNLAV